MTYILYALCHTILTQGNKEITVPLCFYVSSTKLLVSVLDLFLAATCKNTPKSTGPSEALTYKTYSHVYVFTLRCVCVCVCVCGGGGGGVLLQCQLTVCSKLWVVQIPG